MDYTRNTIGAARKAMEDSILPALAQSRNSYAIEQATLVTGILAFAEERIEYVADRQALQLRRSLDLADRLRELSEHEGEPDSELRDAESRARSALGGGASGVDRRRALASLDAAVRRFLLDLLDDDELRDRARSVVLEETDRQIESDRVWLVPMGFEPDPDALKTVDELFALT